MDNDLTSRRREDDSQPPAELRLVRLARDAHVAHQSRNDLTFADVELVDILGRECSARGGDGDALDQLTFRLRQRLTRQLAMIAAVRRGRQKAEAC